MLRNFFLLTTRNVLLRCKLKSSVFTEVAKMSYHASSSWFVFVVRKLIQARKETFGETGVTKRLEEQLLKQHGGT